MHGRFVIEALCRPSRKASSDPEASLHSLQAYSKGGAAGAAAAPGKTHATSSHHQVQSTSYAHESADDAGSLHKVDIVQHVVRLTTCLCAHGIVCMLGRAMRVVSITHIVTLQ
jgi:hypothetical protein